MPLFRCVNCNSVENTALTDFWQQRMASVQNNEPFAPLCSECQTGTWHNKFPKQSATGYYLSARGFLHRPSEFANLRDCDRRDIGKIVAVIGPNGEEIPSGRPPRNE